jgi:hypothetical protein
VPDIKQYIFKLVKYIQPVQLELAYAIVGIDHQMVMIQIWVGNNFIDDVLINRGSIVNIKTKNLIVQLGLSKPNVMPYNLCTTDQIIAKPLGLIRDLKIFVHGILYIVTFIIINNKVLDYSYSMLARHAWLRDAKISHNWGTNIVTIQRTNTIKTIHVTKKLGVQTKRLEVSVYYDFHLRISNDEKDVMFATKLYLFSVGPITIPTNTKLVPKHAYIPNIVIIELVPKQYVKPIGVLVVKLIIPPNIVKQHLLETFSIQRLER